MSDGSASQPPRDGRKPGPDGERSYSEHPEAVKDRKRRQRGRVKRALQSAPIPAVPGTPAALQMATSKLLAGGVIRIARAGRMYAVEQMLLRGASPGQIYTRICADYGCSVTQVREDVAYLKPTLAAQLEESVLVPAAERRAADRAVLVDLYDQCIAAGDRRTARMVWQDICRIDGAFAPIRLDVRVAPAVTDTEAAEAARRLSELLGQSDRRIIDAKSSEAVPGGPVRVLPAPEEMH